MEISLKLNECLLRAVNNFDDEEELVQHMQERHLDVIERIKGPSMATHGRGVVSN